MKELLVEAPPIISSPFESPEEKCAGCKAGVFWGADGSHNQSHKDCFFDGIVQFHCECGLGVCDLHTYKCFDCGKYICYACYCFYDDPIKFANKKFDYIYLCKHCYKETTGIEMT